MAPSMSYASKLGVGATTAVDKQYEFVTCGVGKTGAQIVSPGMRGTRSVMDTQVSSGPYAVGGSFVIEPRPDDLDNLLPWILGAAASGTTFALAETVPERYVHIEKVGGSYLYAGCKVNRATFRSSTGGNLQLELDIVGKTEASGAFPSISASLSANIPYTHHQAVLTLVAATYEFPSVEIVIDNHLVTDRFNNSVTRTAIPEGDRTVMISFATPFTATEIAAVYDLALAGVAGNIVYTNGNRSALFTFANLKAATQPIQISDRRSEIMMPLQFQAFKSGSTNELVVTNDSTG